MRKIVSGRALDTETSKLIGRWSNQSPDPDKLIVEELYKTRKSSRYFIFSTGGKDTLSPGQDFTLCTYRAAKEWAKEKLSADKYSAEFDILDCKGSKVQCKVYLSEMADAVLNQIKAKTKKSKSEIIEELILERYNS